MSNIKKEVKCNCGANILDKGLTDVGDLHLHYSKDSDSFNKGNFEFSFIPSQCDQCMNDISDSIQSELTQYYPLLSELEYPSVLELVGSKDNEYIQQFCKHCGADLKEEGISVRVSVELSYDSLTGRFKISHMERQELDDYKCGCCCCSVLSEDKKPLDTTSICAIPKI